MLLVIKYIKLHNTNLIIMIIPIHIVIVDNFWVIRSN